MAVYHYRMPMRPYNVAPAAHDNTLARPEASTAPLRERRASNKSRPPANELNTENPSTNPPLNVAEPDDLVELDKCDPSLSFLQNTSSIPYLYEEGQSRLSIIVAAHLSGRFFGSSTGPIKSQSQLTCYRRNMFQVEGSITIPRNIHALLSSGSRRSIVALRATLVANESWNRETVKLIVIPPKSKPSLDSSASTAESGPPPLDFSFSSLDIQSSDMHSFTMAWSRLQFRVATSKNGRRLDKKLDQHFNLEIYVKALFSEGPDITLYKAASAAITVRGRSPQNFNSANKTGQATPKLPQAIQSSPLTLVEDQGMMADPVSSHHRVPFLRTSLHSPKIGVTDIRGPASIDHSTWDNSTPALPIDDSLASGFSFDFEDNLTSTNYWPHWSHDFHVDPSADALRSHLSNLDFSPSLVLDQDQASHAPVLSASPLIASPEIPTSSYCGLVKPQPRYEYIPLSLDDRTPPVQAVYVRILVLNV